MLRRVMLLLSVVAWFAACSPRALGAGALVPEGGGSALECVREEVAATVRDGLATTRVVEVFRNPGDRPLEAVYAFTLPRGAAVTDFPGVI